MFEDIAINATNLKETSVGFQNMLVDMIRKARNVLPTQVRGFTGPTPSNVGWILRGHGEN